MRELSEEVPVEARALGDRVDALARERAALRRVAALAVGEVDTQRVFTTVCRELAVILGVESTDIIRFEDESTATVLGVWASESAPSFPAGERIPIDGGTVTGKIHRSRRPERVDDYSEVEGDLAARLRDFGFLSVVGAPITVSGRLWGAIMASAGRPYAFPEDTEEKLAEFAELVTVALANADAREQLAASRARIVEAGYEERRRLGRDLHDGAQQELVGAAMSLRLARQKLAEADGEAAELLSAALEQIQTGLRSLRELAAGIHPSVLTDRGLGAALEALAARSPMEVELRGFPCKRLPASVETTAYFVVAEALTNAAKHSRCETVEVEVSVDSSWAVIEVRDDGVGGADPLAGTGLRGLADRVSALGGELEVRSPAGAGTKIAARLALAG